MMPKCACHPSFPNALERFQTLCIHVMNITFKLFVGELVRDGVIVDAVMRSLLVVNNCDIYISVWLPDKCYVVEPDR